MVLTPGQIVIALVTEVASPFRNREYAREIGSWCILALQSLGLRGVEHRGISDLAIGERKILGSTVYRRKLTFFYQASLLVDLDTRIFSRYLRFPSRVPDYRRGRSHEDFCTTLARAGCGAGVSEVLAALETFIGRELPGLL